jgi:Transposase, Mutator family
MPGRQFPKVETMLHDAAGDITAFAGFPLSRWKKIWSTSPLECLNKGIKRRTGVVGVIAGLDHPSPGGLAAGQDKQARAAGAGPAAGAQSTGSGHEHHFREAWRRAVEQMPGVVAEVLVEERVDVRRFDRDGPHRIDGADEGGQFRWRQA